LTSSRGKLLEDAIKARLRYEQMQAQATEQYRAAVVKALDAGVTYRELATARGMSPATLHQLVKGKDAESLATVLSTGRESFRSPHRLYGSPMSPQTA
jgi:hypothetical protein